VRSDECVFPSLRQRPTRRCLKLGKSFGRNHNGAVAHAAQSINSPIVMQVRNAAAHKPLRNARPIGLTSTASTPAFSGSSIAGMQPGHNSGHHSLWPGGDDPANAKTTAMKAAGIHVANSPATIGEAMPKALGVKATAAAKQPCRQFATIGACRVTPRLFNSISPGRSAGLKQSPA
jgi:hypothetical protein